MFKKLEIIMYVLIGLFVVYGIVCYADILAHNLSGGSDASWNLLVNMMEK